MPLQWRNTSNPPSLISRTVSVDVKHHVYLLTCVTKSGRVWRKVPESDAWSVHVCKCQCARVCVCVSEGVGGGAKPQRQFQKSVTTFGQKLRLIEEPKPESPTEVLHAY